MTIKYNGLDFEIQSEYGDLLSADCMWEQLREPGSPNSFNHCPLKVNIFSVPTVKGSKADYLNQWYETLIEILHNKT